MPKSDVANNSSAEPASLHQPEIVSPEIVNGVSFNEYARTIRKVPNKATYANFFREASVIGKNTKTSSEINQIQVRKQWSDMVSATYVANEGENVNQHIKTRVLQRLTDLGEKKVEDLYFRLLSYIRDHSVITISFNPNFLHKGLNDLEVLNTWDKNVEETGYHATREETERRLFSHLPSELKTHFLNNKSLRPRYGALYFTDTKNSLKSLSCYGNSFIVLKDIVKFNSLFAPGDTWNYNMSGESYKISTFHHLEFLLYQCPINTLKALIRRVNYGELQSSNYNQNTWGLHAGGYIEALLPAVNIFDPNMVEHIHIDENSFKIKNETLEAIKTLGISISNSTTSPYSDLNDRFFKAIETDDVETVKTLLKMYPSLLHNSNSNNFVAVQAAVQFGSEQIFNFFVHSKIELKNFFNSISLMEIAVKFNQFKMLKSVLNILTKQTNKTESQLLSNVAEQITALNLLSQDGNDDLLLYLNSHGIPVYEVQSADHLETLLSRAIHENNLQRIQILLPFLHKNFNLPPQQQGDILKRLLLNAQKPERPEIAYELAKAFLPVYISITELRPKNHYKNRFLGIGLGYSSDQKLTASKALQAEVTQNPMSVDLSHFKGELTNGELGLIARNLKIKFPKPSYGCFGF